MFDGGSAFVDKFRENGQYYPEMYQRGLDAAFFWEVNAEVASLFAPEIAGLSHLDDVRYLKYASQGESGALRLARQGKLLDDLPSATGVQNWTSAYRSGARTPREIAIARSKQAATQVDVMASNQLMGQFDVVANMVGRKGFASADDAAYFALQESNLASIADNTEFGGLIYRAPDGTYGYTVPSKGTPLGFDPNSVASPKGSKLVGDYHTHGDYSLADSHGKPIRTSNPALDGFDSDNFSDPDIDGISWDAAGTPGYTGYLGTPSGKFYKFTPKIK